MLQDNSQIFLLSFPIRKQKEQLHRNRHPPVIRQSSGKAFAFFSGKNGEEVTRRDGRFPAGSPRTPFFCGKPGLPSDSDKKGEESYLSSPASVPLAGSASFVEKNVHGRHIRTLAAWARTARGWSGSLAVPKRKQPYRTTLMTEPEPSMLAAMASQSGPRKKPSEVRSVSGLPAATGSERLPGSPLTTRICPPATRCQTPLNWVTGSASNMCPSLSGPGVSAAGDACPCRRPRPCFLSLPARRGREKAPG